MANAFYDAGREGFADGTINWPSGTIKAAFLDSSYSFDTTHRFASSLSGIVGRTSALTAKSNAGGILDAADIDTAGIAAALLIRSLAIYQDSGAGDATSRLILYLDQLFNAQHINLTTDGGLITIAWDNGVNKIGRI